MAVVVGNDNDSKYIICNIYYLGREVEVSIKRISTTEPIMIISYHQINPNTTPTPLSSIFMYAAHTSRSEKVTIGKKNTASSSLSPYYSNSHAPLILFHRHRFLFLATCNIFHFDKFTGI